MSKTHICNVCGAEYKRLSSYLRHRESAHDCTTFWCKICRKGFDDKVTVTYHILYSHHKTNNINAYIGESKFIYLADDDDDEGDPAITCSST